MSSFSAENPKEPKLGVIFRQSLKASISTYIGIGIGYVNVIYLFPKYLDESEIGILRFLLEAATVLSGFVLMGGASAMVRYYPKLPKSPADHGFGFLVFSMPIVGLVFFWVLAWPFKDVIIGYFRPNASELLPYWIWLLPLVLFTVYSTVAETYASIRNRITVPRLIKDVIQRVGLSAAAIGIGTTWIGFEHAVLLVVAVYGGATFLNLAYLRSLGRISLRPNFSGIGTSLARDYLSYTGLVLAGSLGSMLLSRVDFIMITSMEGIAATGIYSTAFYMAMVIETPKRAIQQISAPILSDGIHRGDHALVLDLYRKSSINQLLIGGLIFLGIWVNLDTVFDWMPNGDVYRGGAMVFFFIGVSRLLDLSIGLGGVILYNSDYYKYSVPMGFLTTGVAIIGNLLLIPVFGIGGAAVATAIGYAILTVYIAMLVRWKSGIQPFTRKTWILVLMLAVTLAAHHQFGTHSGEWTDILVNTGLFWVPFAVFSLIFRISPDIDTLLRNSFRL